MEPDMTPPPNPKGCLFIVATPIGNLSDITQRAIDTLASVDLIAAEDTRHTKKLMAHLNLSTPLVAYHEHNDRDAMPELIRQLEAGKRIALVSDAGTPLISDPGYPLVATAHRKGIRVSPIPGPCAVIAAASASGLPTNDLRFVGFLPPKGKKREIAIESLAKEPSCSVIYESVHRIESLIRGLEKSLEPNRHIAIARELTKQYESIYTGCIADIAQDFDDKKVPIKGEFVVIVAPFESEQDIDTLTLPKEELLKKLLNTLPLREAVSLYCDISGDKRKAIYTRALELTKRDQK